MKARLEYMGWSTRPRGSTVYGKLLEAPCLSRRREEVTTLGTAVDATLDEVSFKQVQDQWRVELKAYDKFCDLYASAIRRIAPSRRVPISQWQGPIKVRGSGFRSRHLTAEEKQYQSMTSDVKVRYVIFVDQFMLYVHAHVMI